MQSYRGATHSFVLDEELSQRLKALSRREGVTLFMVLLGAYGVLLSRYSGAQEVVVGTPVAGRTRMETEGLIGFFVNTLALRVKVQGERSFREVLEGVRRVALGGYEHQELPFEKLVEELQPERDLSRNPLFQVFFNMLNFPYDRFEFPGLTLEPLMMPESSSKFDMTLYVDDQNEQLKFNLVYNADLFEPERMLEMLKQYERLLSQIVDRPEENVYHYSLLTESSATVLPDPTKALTHARGESLHELFARQAERMPDQFAVVDPEEALTYGEIDRLSNQVANYLCAGGVQAGEIVAVYGHRSATLIWTLLGVLKAGAAFTVLDPSYPSSYLCRLAHLANSRACLHLSKAGALPETLSEFVASLSENLYLELPSLADEAHARLCNYSVEEPKRVFKRDALAYVAFTSGSTGNPKGIAGEHGPVVHFIHWQTKTFALHERDRFSMLSGLSHDPLLRDIFSPLSLGALLCIPDQEKMRAPGYLANWMGQQAVTVSHLTPAMLQLLLEAPARGTSQLTEDSVLRSLRYAFFGGDVLTWRDVKRLKALVPAITCVNFYGATETPQAVAHFVIPGSEGRDREADSTTHASEIIPIGQGISDVQLLVFNAARQLAGVCEKGEIYVRTPYLARGYVADEALTRERFLPDLFAPPSTTRLYRTGDNGRYCPDGAVEFLGRNDQQLKIRGYRVEPAEVGDVLHDYKAVRQALVTLREDATGDKKLVAYLVLHEGQQVTSAELREHARERLPEYMIPSAFITLDTMPLTPNGKVDYQRLPSFETRRPENFQALPGGPVEEMLVELWSEVLGVDQVSVHDNFFDLGGHSLLATRLISRVRETFQIEIELRSLFDAPTVSTLAEKVRLAMRNGRETALPPLRPVR